MCVERREQLREHEFAILPDGFMTRGAFVERRRFYDGNPFVGENGLKQQLAWKEKQRDTLDIEERQLVPVERAIKAINEACRDQFELPPDLYQDLARAQELPRLRLDLENNIEKLQHIDRAKFDNLAQQQSARENALAAMETEQRGLLQSEKRLQLRNLEAQLKTQTDEAQALERKFTEIRNSRDVSLWTGRLNRLRECMLGGLPAKDASATRFNQLLHRLENRATAVWERLKAKRRELAVVHSKFEDLQPEAETNEEYEKQLAKLGDYITEYKIKAERERKNWEGLFRTQVLEKLTAALQSVKDLLYVLNLELKKRPIGNDHYHLHYWQNPEFKVYHDLLAKSWTKEGDLWFASLEPVYRDAIESFLKLLLEAPDSAAALRLLDYRHYYDYDMDVIEEDGRKTSVDRQSSKFSGGENQSPYFVAILASYLRAYR